MPAYIAYRSGASIWFENWGVVVLKIQQTEKNSTGLRLSSRNFHSYTIFLFLKSHHFQKVFSSHIPVHYRRYDNILWRPHDLLSQNMRVVTPQPHRIDA